MPTINIYKYPSQDEISKSILSELKSFVAKELTCGDIVLSSEEVSVRVLSVSGSMIGEIEVEIHAQAFPERIAKQDEVCNAIRKFLLKKLPRVHDVRIWLVLSELGHSW